MEKELDPEVVKTTQISLGKYVKRPPLSEKLLKKPPFRFLHDIITSVLKGTGFFENLFDDEELVSDNVKDRDSKILFLNKVIFVVASTTGKSITAKPSKIVAGQEPDKTNELLQSLALALDKKLSSEEAVKKYKESLKAPQAVETKTKDVTKSSKKGNESKKTLTSRSSEKLTNQKNDTNIRSTSKNDKDKVNDNKLKKKEIRNKAESQPKKSNQLKASSKKSVDSKGQNNEDTEIQTLKKSTTVGKERMEQSLPKLQSRDSNESIDKDDDHTDAKINEKHRSPIIEGEEQININDSNTIREHDLNSPSSNDLMETAKIVENKSLEINAHKEVSVADDSVSIAHDKSDTAKNSDLTADYHDASKPSFNEDNNKIETDNKANVPRKHDSSTTKSPPASADDASNYNVRPQSVRPSSSRPGAPRMREKLDNAVRDSDNLTLGKVNIIVENTQNEEDEDTSLVVIEQQMDQALSSNGQQEWNTSSSEHGHLVQLILDSQKELSEISGKTEIEWQFGAHKAREAMNQEIEQLRFNIQALSRVANPLGKLLDHIQEDVEVMRQELQQWTNIYDEVTKEMLKQKTLNEDSLLPLHTKLKQLERDIEDKRDKMNDLKISVHQNASRIEKLLGSGDVQ